MTKWVALVAGLLVVGGTSLAASAFFRQPPPTPRVQSDGSGCRARLGGQLPDPACTPGVIDPHVTQANIARTICRPGYTRTVRPPSSYTSHLKLQQILQYHYSDLDPVDYEEDHLISLELGGSPTDPKNLWPESPPSPNPKDKIENALHKLVCTGKLSLAQAQHAIATDWREAL